MRRRQRSARVTVSVSLLSVASVAVVSSLPAQSALWLSVASVLAVALSCGALRMMWTEVLQSRRENAADRAAAAAAYRNLFAVRAAEHADFTTAMTERLARAHISQRELEGLIVQHETRGQRAEARLATEIEAHAETRGRVRQLEQALVSSGTDDGSVVELVTWDEEMQKKAARKTAQKSRTLKQA
jgi:C4-dicarboxylate-specific signal transduction histidine kinase